MFEAAWSDDSACGRIVREHWSLDIPAALRDCGKALADWGHAKYRIMKVSIEIQQRVLEALNSLNVNAGKEAIRAEERKLDCMLDKEATYWKQRS